MNCVDNSRQAILPDGTVMHPHDYWNTRQWKKLCADRHAFDNWQCVICHEPAESCHHIDNRRYGHEELTDIVSVCVTCHQKFHSLWKQADYWKDNAEDTWEIYSLEHTARMCAMYYKEDKFICRDVDAPNLCDKYIQREYIDRYFADNNITNGVPIWQMGFELFVRNKRYELFLNSGYTSADEDKFLDEYFGTKGKLRSEAKQKFFSKWRKKGEDPLEALTETYKENNDVVLLIEEAKKYAET